MESETADRILQTANALLIERGYSAFSYADIADAVQIRKASIHYHFPTKAELVVGVLRAHRGRIREGMESLDRRFSNPLARLREYFRFWEGCIADQTMSFCIGALLSAEMPSLPDEVQAEVREHFAMLTKWFELTLRAGAKSQEIALQATVDTEAQLLIAAMHGAMLSARATRNCDVFRAVTRTVLSRITPPRQ